MLSRVAVSTCARFGASATTSTFARAVSARSTNVILASSQSSVTTKSVGSPYPMERRHFSSPSIEPDHAVMFCRQCEQTKDGIACTTLGVCGKTPETSAVQDALIQVIKSISMWCVAARQAGATPEELDEANAWTLRAAFATLTNVNFSDRRCAEYIHDGMTIKKNILEPLVGSKGGNPPSGNVADLNIRPDMSSTKLEDFGRSVGVLARQKQMGNVDAFSLNEIATYGAKGVSAYATHCYQLGQIDEGIMSGLHEVWTKLASDEPDMDGLLATVLRVGELSVATLKLLDEAHAIALGEPGPCEIRVTAVEGKAILVSGHDMMDLKHLLEQTEGTGINVYTHGEMLPAHSYPELRKHKHLVGNYGTAWQNQKIEFATFPGPIIMTTNCIIEPRRAYKKRIYTMNEVGFDGVKHIGPDRNFSGVIEQALKLKGFPRTIEPARFHPAGFNHRAVLPLAGKVIEAAKSGDLSRIFLIGGCDGTEWDRSYFTDLAEETPNDSLILTMGCAKNRVIHSEKLNGATLANGLPRVLDMGQCNDSYSAIVVAQELAKALDCDINELPLSLALSHLEQKAAAVLLALLHLGVKDIRLGPRLPAYVTPNILDVLSKTFNLMPTGNAMEDLEAMMDGK